MDRLTFAAEYEVTGDRLSGVAHVFGEQGVRNGELWEFDARAFTQSIRNREVTAFYSHDTDKPLASQSAGTLLLAVENGQLQYEIPQLGRQTYAMDLRENIAQKLMNRMSFGIILPESESRTSRDGQGRTVRTFTRAKLYDVSPVALPFFSGTEAAIHSATADTYQREKVARAIARAGGLHA